MSLRVDKTTLEVFRRLWEEGRDLTRMEMLDLMETCEALYAAQPSSSRFKVGDVVRLSGQGAMAPFMTITDFYDPLASGDWYGATCTWFLNAAHRADAKFPLKALDLVDPKEEA